MRYEGNDRYQFQPRRVKALRWLRWKPWYALRLAWDAAKWACLGCPILHRMEDVGVVFYPGSRPGTLRMLGTMNMGMADYRMGAYWSVEEVFAAVRARREPPPAGPLPRPTGSGDTIHE